MMSHKYIYDALIVKVQTILSLLSNYIPYISLITITIENNYIVGGRNDDENEMN